VLVDGFTIIAQVVNFLILLVLMRRFLYRPILKAMDEREQNITLRQREAQRHRQEADREAQDYRDLKAEFEEQRENLLAQTQSEAEEQRKQLIREARQEVEQAKAAWYRAIQEEKEALLLQLNQYVSRETITIARRAMKDLADSDLEDRIVNVFMERLRSLEQDERASIANSLNTHDDNLLINTAFPLSGRQEEQIRHTIAECLGDNHAMVFEENPDLLCGIELKAPGHKISWSLSSYLESLEETLFQLIRNEEARV
jgi:F-type H+-transporting ATPase subunit b